MAWQSVVPTIANAAVSIWGTHQQNKNIDKQLVAQASENAKIRAHNLNLAKLQNTWNLQQWQRENAYNDPSAQIARMRAAGLNPDMMYGGGVSGNLSASSPAMSSGAAATPMDWSSLGNKKTIAQAAAETLNLEQMRANIRKTNAEARSEGYHGDILESDAKVRDALNQGQIDLTNMTIQGINSDIQVNTEQISKMRAEMRNLDQETENLKKSYNLIEAQISNLDADTAFKKVRAALDTKESEALIKKMAADTNLSKAECRAIVSRLPYELLGLKNDAESTSTDTKFVKLQNDVLTWQFDQDKNYDDWKRSIGIAGDIVNALEGLASIIGMALGSGKPTRIRGLKN